MFGQSIYFTMVPEDVRKQHLKAVAAINDLSKTEMALQIESRGENGSSQVTYINTEAKSTILSHQIKSLVIPPHSVLSRVHVFHTADNKMVLNMFGFTHNDAEVAVATPADAKDILACAAEIQTGTLIFPCS